jgi:monothiol glutaredoxin
VAQNAVLVYMKGTPTAPQCGFSNMVCRILDGHGTAARVRSGGEPRAHALAACACAGVAYASRNVLEDADLRQGIKSFTCAVAPAPSLLSPPQRV